MSFDCFDVSVAEGVATVTMNRPPVNAQNRAFREEITEIFDGFSDDPDVRVIILTGSGKVFSAGADLKERVDVTAERGRYIRHNRVTRESFYAITDCAKPVIAAVNGPAIGAGFGLATHADMAICSDTTYAQMPEVDFGLNGGGRTLERFFPRAVARYLYFTAAKIPAEDLLRFGVVSEVVSQDRLMPRAQEIAAVVASKNPQALERAKYAFNTGAELPFRDAYRFEQSITAELSKAKETQLAQQAFGQK